MLEPSAQDLVERALAALADTGVLVPGAPLEAVWEVLDALLAEHELTVLRRVCYRPTETQALPPEPQPERERESRATRRRAGVYTQDDRGRIVFRPSP